MRRLQRLAVERPNRTHLGREMCATEAHFDPKTGADAGRLGKDRPIVKRSAEKAALVPHDGCAIEDELSFLHRFKNRLAVSAPPVALLERASAGDGYFKVDVL